MEAIFDDEAQVNCAIEAEPDPKASTDFTRLKAIGETSLGAASVESENSDADCSPLAFSYQPLKESDGIRLVLIHPAPDVSAHLECSIQHATLSQYDQDLMNHYHALSYVWGDATNTRKITVEGYPIQVTVTLESALRRLRDRERIIRVWADALCINQADTDERNQQVRQMGTVYSVARHTVIDLGEGSEETDSILDQLAGFGTVGNIPVPKHVLRDRYGDTKLKALADGLKEQILGRPWFSRVWVFQELLLSQDPWVQCGSKRLKWESLCHFLRVFRSNGKSEYTLGGRPKQGGSNASMELDALQRLEGLEEARLNFQQHLVGRGEGNSLLSLLSSRRGLGVTDPRDMIYAHFGIMSDTFPGHLKNEVDYSKSVIELYTEIALYLFHKYKDCRMLTFVEDTDPLKRLRGLPSWVPDWT
ncbi:HET-domain-containing protein, partial [Acephala macrosclerotiorum]